MTTAGQKRDETHLTASDLGIQSGAMVMSADNKRLGDVGETRGRYFKVRRRLASDYWLDLNDIAGVFQDQVIVEFRKSDVVEHHVPASIVSDQRLDARVDHLLNDTQMEEQRARMERDLKR